MYITMIEPVYPIRHAHRHKDKMVKCENCNAELIVNRTVIPTRCPECHQLNFKVWEEN